MLEGLAQVVLLKDIQIILPNMIKCVKLGMINIYDHLNGGTPRGMGVCGIAPGSSQEA